MKVNNKNYRAVWMEGRKVMLVDQTLLPFEFKIFIAKNYLETCEAIKDMKVRGAGTVGATAGFAMAQAFLEAPENNFWEFVDLAKKTIEATRPTAQNLFYAVNRVYQAGKNLNNPVEEAIKEAQVVADSEAESGRKMGEYGNNLIKDGFNIMTHCNTGWLALVDYGSALAPIYLAHNSGKKIFVYADETRPRGQGARLTAWELNQAGIPHVVVPDNAGAYLMSQGKVDIMLVGADRIAKNGDTANKIGTLEKAIIAHEYGVPFYVVAPTSTFDLNCESGKDIIIEQRNESEVLFQTGLTDSGKVEKILVCSPDSHAINPAFDVTPAKYITGIITEKGMFKSNEIGFV